MLSCLHDCHWTSDWAARLCGSMSESSRNSGSTWLASHQMWQWRHCVCGRTCQARCLWRSSCPSGWGAPPLLSCCWKSVHHCLHAGDGRLVQHCGPRCRLYLHLHGSWAPCRHTQGIFQWSGSLMCGRWQYDHRHHRRHFCHLKTAAVEWSPITIIYIYKKKPSVP